MFARSKVIARAATSLPARGTIVARRHMASESCALKHRLIRQNSPIMIGKWVLAPTTARIVSDGQDPLNMKSLLTDEEVAIQWVTRLRR